MNLFRKALETALQNDACREGNLVYFAPADQFVPIAWVEEMAEHEWECCETGSCSHPAAKTYGCYNGQWAGDEWICDCLLQDRNVLQRPVAEIVKRIS